MIVTFEEAKNWLRVDFSDDDALITTLINAAEEYLKNATGTTFDATNYLAKIFCMTLIADWYENREMIGKATDQTRPIIQSILTQLTYSYGGDSDESGTV
ncbi:putative phage protein (predicted DNA packaging) [Anoxybacillus tepidamans]|uniref:Putative phage protein (Predicted DNA packaging) n=1 Tax=Anoxybacteroides tepidamans TaxID=265948 RepID=A0A7W8MV47_9BACL|nr:head-tail connector protein [Anoxybacillus tepidamans]MBB5325197.1 putative phage protein (predicted DNA packaging) [Anoxybacillus tepidamans]